mgnify:CR=1 FL=1
MPAPTYQSHATAAAAAAASIACNVPSGVADGDLLVARVYTLNNPDVTHSTPAGWTLIRVDATTNPTVNRVSTYSRIAASEPASYTFSFAGSPSDALAAISRVTGAHASSPIDAHASNLYSATTTPHECPSVTTSVDECLLLLFDALPIASTTETAPGGSTQQYQFVSSGGVTARSSLATKEAATAGATGANSWSLSTARVGVATSVAIAPAAAPSDVIAIASPVANQGFQRIGGQATATVSGTYSGPSAPTAIEWRTNSGTWATLDAAPSGGTFSGDAAIPEGVNDVQVRFANDTGVNDSVANVRVGDVFLWIGQSNQSGRLTNGQAFTGGVACSIFDESGVWSTLASNYKDPNETLFSVLPRLASLIVDDTGVPAIFVCRTSGASGVVAPDADWADGGGEFSAATTAVQSSAINGATLILFGQGERDAVNGIAAATYAAAETAMLDAMQAAQGALAGVKMATMSIGELAAATTGDISSIQQAKIDNWNSDPDIVPGPTAHDQDFPDDAHWTSDAQAVILAGRWWRAIRAAVYGGGEDARGPRFASATFENEVVTVSLAGGVSPLVNGDDATGWEVSDGVGTRTVSATSADGLIVSLICDQPLTSPVSLSYGRGDTAVGTTTTDSGSIQALPIESFVNQPASSPAAIAARGVFAPAFAG